MTIRLAGQVTLEILWVQVQVKCPVRSKDCVNNIRDVTHRLAAAIQRYYSGKKYQNLFLISAQWLGILTQPGGLNSGKGTTIRKGFFHF